MSRCRYAVRKAQAAKVSQRLRECPHARGVYALANRLAGQALFLRLARQRRRLHAARGGQRAHQALARRIRALLQARASAGIALTGQQRLLKALGAPQRIAALQQAQHGGGIQFARAVDVAVLARHQVGQFGAIRGHAQARGHPRRQLRAARLVAQVARQQLGRRASLAQVVHQAGPAHGQRAKGDREADIHRREAMGLTHPDIVSFIADEGLESCLERVKSDNAFVRQYALESLHESLTLDYASYILALAMGALFFITVGINGIIENKQDVLEPDATREKYKAIEKKYAPILSAGLYFPALTFLILFMYMITPTSKGMFIAFISGILIRNIFNYFSTQHRKPEMLPEE